MHAAGLTLHSKQTNDVLLMEKKGRAASVVAETKRATSGASRAAES